MQLSINSEYEALLPKLSKLEYEALKESVKTEGQHYPIIVGKEGIILDGHNRLQICEELGMTPKYEVKEFPSSLDEKLFVIDANLQRRQLNAAQKVWLNMERYGIEKEKAKQRMSKGGGSVHLNLPEDEKGQSRDIVASHAGVSPITTQRALTVFEKGDEQTKQRMLEGKTSINYAYKMTKRKLESQEYPELPQGQYDIIYADPPWRYDLPFAGSPDMHYPTLETEKICRLETPSAQDAILFLWATNPFLKDALRVMESWGFEYKTNMVWVKDKTGTGYWIRGQHELLLIGIKGKKHPPLEQDRVSSVINAPRTKHSKKPELAYKLIEKMFPNRKYLELFARNHRERWTSWGVT